MHITEAADGSQRLDGLEQHAHGPVRKITFIAQQRTNITQHAKRDVTPCLRLLKAVLQSTGMLPFSRRNLRTLNDTTRNATHCRAVHTEAALRNTILEFVEEGNLALFLVDMNLHPPSSNLWMVLELGG